MFRVETTVVVNRPIDEVWAFRTSFFHLPRLSGTMLALRQTSPGQIGVGSTVRARLMIVGFEVRADGVFTGWEPPHLLALSATGPGVRSFSMRQTYEAVAGGPWSAACRRSSRERYCGSFGPSPARTSGDGPLSETRG